jgi:GTP-binding protein Era
LLVALNTIDRIPKNQLLPMLDRLKDEIPEAALVPISALTGDNVDRLWEILLSMIPDGPPYYSLEAITEHPERFFVAEIIREQILLQFREEVPYAVQVEIERFEEPEGLKNEIDAVIIVERDSQKAILIGSKGSAIKQLGVRSRAAVEEFLERPVVLKLFVKVVPGWRQDPRALRRMGYAV